MVEQAGMLADLAADAAWRRNSELLAQRQVLAPSGTDSYSELFDQAQLRRDAGTAAAIVEQARQARALDTSQAEDSRRRWASGSLDAKAVESIRTRVAAFDEIAATPKLDVRTRAAALFLAAGHRGRLGILEADPALATRSREDLAQAMTLWPALESNYALIGAQIDEVALAADGKRWRDLRRSRSGVAALAELTAAGDPLAAAVRAAPAWSALAALARADHTPPGLDDVRLARLLGDADLIARAAAAFDDKLVRLAVELRRLTDPTDPTLAADLALLDGH